MTTFLCPQSGLLKPLEHRFLLADNIAMASEEAIVPCAIAFAWAPFSNAPAMNGAAPRYAAGCTLEWPAPRSTSRNGHRSLFRRLV